MYTLIMVSFILVIVFCYSRKCKKDKLKLHLKQRLKTIDINICNNDEINKEIDIISQSIRLPKNYISSIYNEIVQEILDDLIVGFCENKRLTKENEEIIIKAMNVYNPADKKKYTSMIDSMREVDDVRYDKVRLSHR